MLGFDDSPFWVAPLLDPVQARHHSLQFPVQGCGVLTDFDAGRWIQWILLLLGPTLSKMGYPARMLVFVQTMINQEIMGYPYLETNPYEPGSKLSSCNVMSL